MSTTTKKDGRRGYYFRVEKYPEIDNVVKKLIKSPHHMTISNYTDALLYILSKGLPVVKTEVMPTVTEAP